MDDHPLAVNVGDLQIESFLAAKSRAVVHGHSPTTHCRRNSNIDSAMACFSSIASPGRRLTTTPQTISSPVAYLATPCPLKLASQTHRLHPPVGEGAPTPLHRSESKEAEPERTDYQIDAPDAENNIEQLVIFEPAVEPPRAPDKEGLAEYRGEQVVGERHLADCGHRLEQRTQDPAFDEKQQHCGDSEGSAKLLRT